MVATYVSLQGHLFDCWDKIAPRLADPGRVALFADFDGTLAPICSRPQDARIPPPTRKAWAACVKEVAVAGVISGRALQDVRRRVGVRGAWYAGVHGYSMVSPGNRHILALSRKQRERMVRVAGLLSQSLADLTGIYVENKEAAISVHYRNAPLKNRRRAGRLVRALMAESQGLRLMSGRKVWEILPSGEVNKASAVRFILKHSGPRRTVVFLGDDVTDEAVFRRIPGIMILVGERRRTAARYWLRSPGEVRQFLERCLDLWK